MVRFVLACDPSGKWRLFRQPQWMAEIRRNIEAAGWSKFHFDMDESVYLQLLKSKEDWANLTQPEILEMVKNQGGLFSNPPANTPEEA